MAGMRTLSLALSAALLAGALPRTAAADEAAEWRAAAVQAVRADESPTAKAARAYALVHAALARASRLRGVVRAAAAAQAAHDVLLSLFPLQREALDTKLALALVDVPDSPAKARAIALGKRCAEQALGLATPRRMTARASR